MRMACHQLWPPALQIWNACSQLQWPCMYARLLQSTCCKGQVSTIWMYSCLPVQLEFVYISTACTDAHTIYSCQPAYSTSQDLHANKQVRSKEGRQYEMPIFALTSCLYGTKLCLACLQPEYAQWVSVASDAPDFIEPDVG